MTGTNKSQATKTGLKRKRRTWRTQLCVVCKKEIKAREDLALHKQLKSADGVTITVSIIPTHKVKECADKVNLVAAQ